MCHVRLSEADVPAAQDRIHGSPVLQDYGRLFMLMIADESMRRALGSHEDQFAVSCSGKNGEKEFAAAHGPRSSGVELAWREESSRSVPGNPPTRSAPSYADGSGVPWAGLSELPVSRIPSRGPAHRFTWRSSLVSLLRGTRKRPQTSG